MYIQVTAQEFEAVKQDIEIFADIADSEIDNSREILRFIHHAKGILYVIGENKPTQIEHISTAFLGKEVIKSDYWEDPPFIGTLAGLNVAAVKHAHEILATVFLEDWIGQINLESGVALQVFPEFWRGKPDLAEECLLEEFNNLKNFFEEAT